jgi:hypothetical protein
MEGMEKTCNFQWEQPLEQHKKHIAPSLLKEFNALFYEWKHSKVLDEGVANNQSLRNDWRPLVHVGQMGKKYDALA